MSVDGSKIVCGRYNDLLKGLDLVAMCEHFEHQCVLTHQEVQTVLREVDDLNQKRQLAKILTDKGTKRFSEFSTMIRKYRGTPLRDPASTNGKEEVGYIARSVPNNPWESPDKKHSQMDPFSVLFFTFISQLKSFWQSHKPPAWLDNDTYDESIADFFSPEVARVASQKSVSIKLSVLLEAFQQFASKVSSDSSLVNLRRLLETSEERCKQLVVVTQQWALECEDKDKAISVYEVEIKQLKADIAKLEKRVGKYKRFWQDNRSIEEMRTEDEQRRILYDKVREDKDKFEKQVQQLTQENQQQKATIEKLKDYLAEADDRLGNMKLQASIKEPTAREMSLLRSELRESQAESNQLAAEKKQMEDEIMVLKMTLEEYKSGGITKRQQVQLHQKPKPKPRTQAMVTGFRPQQYNVPRRNPVVDMISDDSDSDTSSEDSLPSSNVSSQTPKRMEIDANFSHNDFANDLGPAGLPPGDYTLGTRYPNHSSIKVLPLDIPPRCAGVVSQEKVCPSCQYSFMTLSDAEFQSHVACCFK